MRPPVTRTARRARRGAVVTSMTSSEHTARKRYIVGLSGRGRRTPQADHWAIHYTGTAHHGQAHTETIVAALLHHCARPHHFFSVSRPFSTTSPQRHAKQIGSRSFVPHETSTGRILSPTIAVLVITSYYCIDGGAARCVTTLSKPNPCQDTQSAPLGSLSSDSLCLVDPWPQLSIGTGRQ